MRSVPPLPPVMGGAPHEHGSRTASSSAGTCAPHTPRKPPTWPTPETRQKLRTAYIGGLSLEIAAAGVLLRNGPALIHRGRVAA